MNGRDGEARLREALMSGTDRAALQKERIWRAVSGRITIMKTRKDTYTMRRRHRILPAGALAATAVVLVAAFFALTPAGTALADRIVKFFAPDKKIETPLEGVTETQNASLQGDTTKEIGYVIYIDGERYVKESRDGVDYYNALNAPEGFPPVQMEISQLADVNPQAAHADLLAQARERYGVVEDRGEVDSPVRGWSVLAYDEGGGEKPYEEDFVVDNTAGGCFVIRCRLFVEAAEGHGARFEAMLTTFEVVESSKVEISSPTPAPESTVAPGAITKLTWDDLAFGGAKLGAKEQDAIDEILKFVCLNGGTEAPVSDETANDAGGTTRTILWGDGTVATIRNGKLYSMESTNPTALMPNGLHAGLNLLDFAAALGAPREVPGEFAWGVGSNDNLFVRVQNGIVISVRISLIE